MAEPATKTKAGTPAETVSAEEFAELKAQMAEQAARTADAEADNAELRELVAEIKRQGQGPAQTPEDAAEVERAQDIADFISGAVFPTTAPEDADPDRKAKAEKGRRLAEMEKPTRMEVVGAIKVIRASKRRELASKRDLEPEELKTMTNGLRAHIASLNECAEMYYEREDI